MTLLLPDTFTTPASTAHHPPDLRLEPVHLRLDLDLRIDAQELVGTATHTVRCNDAGARTLTLNALEFAEVDVQGEGVEFDYDGALLRIHWHHPFDKGEEREVSVRYRVVEPRTGLNFSSPAAYDDIDQARFAVTDNETERARYWLPTVDFAAVRPTLDITLRAEEGLTLLANGALQSDEVVDGRRVCRWVLDAPCPSYLTCIAVGDFVRWDGDGPVPVAAFAPASMHEAASLGRSFDRTGEMIEWMQAKLGCALPYPKYYQFAVPFIGGAMENISLVSWDERFVLDAELHAELKPLVDIVNLHELAHSWFGDHIVCRDQAHSWLKESWATYMESCWLEGVHGAEEARYHRFIEAKAYFTECRQRYVRPIVTRTFDSSWDLYDYHLYPGGALRLHMLRALLGDDVFWTAVRDYVARFGGKTVETEDFRRVMEEHSSRSLTAFFDRWLYSPGHPKVKVRFRYDAGKKEGVFDLEQTQAGKPWFGRSKNKGDEIPVFDVDLELAWTIAGSTDECSVRFDKKSVRHVVKMDKEPEFLNVDPRQVLLHEVQLEVGAPLLRRMLKSPDLVTRINAAFALAKKGRRADVDAIREAFESESFWGAQVQLAEALGSVATDHAALAIAGLCESHHQTLSLAALFRAAALHRHDSVASALRTRIEAGLPPRAREAALEALGAQRREEDEAFLVGESKRGHAVGRLGALRGLGRSTRASALAPLCAALKPGGRRSFVRTAAADGIAALLPRLERGPRATAVDALTYALRDPIGRVRQAAANALIQSGAHEALGALRAYESTLSNQEAPRLRRGLRKLSGGDERRTMVKRIEGLEENLRELRTRLDRVDG
ncbi:MAG: M1 family aminopeptidase [Polyangiales bacterium]